MKYGLVVLVMGVTLSCASCYRRNVDWMDGRGPAPFPAGTCSGDPTDSQCVQRLAADGQCIVYMKYKKNGKLEKIDAVPVPPNTVCEVAGPLSVPPAPDELFVITNAPGYAPKLLKENTGSITFGDNTTTCYGPPPSPPWCVCTRKPCP